MLCDTKLEVWKLCCLMLFFVLICFVFYQTVVDFFCFYMFFFNGYETHCKEVAVIQNVILGVNGSRLPITLSGQDLQTMP